jgi:hypothetical protein
VNLEKASRKRREAAVAPARRPGAARPEPPERRAHQQEHREPRLAEQHQVHRPPQVRAVAK